MSVKLSLANLGDLPQSVAVPRYAREDLRAGILHFGVGNFHRAHQAVYLDDLFNLGLGHDWAIVGAGVLPADAAARTGVDPAVWVLSGGEDHGMLATFPPGGDA